MTIRWSFAPHTKPTSRAIVERMEEAIRLGELAPGAQLPTQRALADELGVSLGTVGRAIAEIQRRGLVSSTVGRGTFVRSSFGPLDPIPTGSEAAERWIDLGSNETFALPIEVEELQRTLRAIGEDGGLASYPSGLERQSRFAEMGWQWLERLGFESGGASLRLATSAQNAALGVLLSMARSGDTILHGATLFPGIRSLAERLGCSLLAIPEDEHGPRPDALAALASKYSVGLVYLTPTLGPIGSRIIPAHRRLELATVVRNEELLVLEDEDDGALLLDRPRPLQSIAPEQVIAVVETSKCFASGSRFSYVVVPEARAEAMELGQRATTWSVPWLPAEVATRWIWSGFDQEASAARREELRWRHELAHDVLAGHVLRGPDFAHNLWLELPAPWSSVDLERALEVQGVHAGSSSSYSGKPGEIQDGSRLCLGRESRERLGQGLRAVREILEGPFRPARSWD